MTVAWQHEQTSHIRYKILTETLEDLAKNWLKKTDLEKTEGLSSVTQRKAAIYEVTALLIGPFCIYLFKGWAHLFFGGRPLN